MNKIPFELLVNNLSTRVAKIRVNVKYRIVEKYGYPWIQMDTNGYKWISIFVHVTPVMDIHGYPWMSRNIHEHPWMLHGHLKRISMDMNGYPSWISVDKHIHRFTPTVFFNRGFHRFLIHSYPGYPWIRCGQLWWTFLMETRFHCKEWISMEIVHIFTFVTKKDHVHGYP